MEIRKYFRHLSLAAFLIYLPSCSISSGSLSSDYIERSLLDDVGYNPFSSQGNWSILDVAVYAFPFELEFGGARYAVPEEDRTDLFGKYRLEESYIHIGYFVNERDLDLWIERDNEPSFRYVVDPNNTLIQRGVSADVWDRFKLFDVGDPGKIGLLFMHCIALFERVV